MRIIGLYEHHLPALLQWPWTVTAEHVTTESPSYWCVRCREIPSAIATGESEAEVEKEFWESLRESLRIHLIHGDSIPVPIGLHERLFSPLPEKGL